MQLAERGDGDAAYRISIHYAFYMQNHAEGQKWLRRASDMGLPKAQTALGRCLVDEPSDASKAKGLALIRESAKAGDEMSIGFLSHLRYLQTFTEYDLKRVQHRIPKLIELIRYLQRHPDEVVDITKRPNKSPEPTPTAVTPRASEGTSK